MLPVFIRVRSASRAFGNREDSKLAKVTIIYAAKASDTFTRTSTGASGELGLVVESTRNFDVFLFLLLHD